MTFRNKMCQRIQPIRRAIDALPFVTGGATAHSRASASATA